MQIPEYHDKPILQHIFRISHGLGIPVAHSQHRSRKFVIQLPLRNRVSPKAVVYQLVMVHSSLIILFDNKTVRTVASLSPLSFPVNHSSPYLCHMNTTGLTERDRRVIWHPYTQHKDLLPPIPVLQGKGSLLFDELGKSYIDAISSWWVNIHGHSHPYIAERLYQQALRLEHVIFTGFTHEPAVRLAERLLPLLPGDFSRVFYSDNGSTAVEVAIKMAIQYWRNTGVPPAAGASAKAGASPRARSRILAFHHSYHGDTFGAMSVSERSLFTAP